jgi:hypothetical protein
LSSLDCPLLIVLSFVFSWLERTINRGQSRVNNQERTINRGQSREGNQERTIQRGQSIEDNQERTLDCPLLIVLSWLFTLDCLLLIVLYWLSSLDCSLFCHLLIVLSFVLSTIKRGQSRDIFPKNFRTDKTRRFFRNHWLNKTLTTKNQQKQLLYLKVFNFLPESMTKKGRCTFFHYMAKVKDNTMIHSKPHRKPKTT